MKHKSKKPDAKKNRETWAKFTLKTTNNGEAILNIQNNRISSPQAIAGSFSNYRSYMRENGKEKIIHQAFSENADANFSLRKHITDNFNIIAGIDTNTLTIKGRKISIAVAYTSLPVLHQNPNLLKIHPAIGFIFDNVRSDLNPETLAWHYFLQIALPLIRKNDTHKVALVVDSELGIIPQINNRTKPYYRNSFLPPKIQLQYASSDKSDDLPNKIIKRCDHTSRNLCQQIETGSITLPETLEPDRHNDCKGYIQIDFKLNQNLTEKPH